MSRSSLFLTQPLPGEVVVSSCRDILESQACRVRMDGCSPFRPPCFCDFVLFVPCSVLLSSCVVLFVLLFVRVFCWTNGGQAFPDSDAAEHPFCSRRTPDSRLLMVVGRTNAAEGA
jgi:hypothetical protein